MVYLRSIKHQGGFVMNELINIFKVKMRFISISIQVLYLSSIHPFRDNFALGYSFQVSSKDFIS